MSHQRWWFTVNKTTKSQNIAVFISSHNFRRFARPGVGGWWPFGHVLMHVSRTAVLCHFHLSILYQKCHSLQVFGPTCIDGRVVVPRLRADPEVQVTWSTGRPARCSLHGQLYAGAATHEATFIRDIYCGVISASGVLTTNTPPSTLRQTVANVSASSCAVLAP